MYDMLYTLIELDDVKSGCHSFYFFSNLEEGLFTFSETLGSLPVFGEVRFTQYSFYVVFSGIVNLCSTYMFEWYFSLIAKVLISIVFFKTLQETENLCICLMN